MKHSRYKKSLTVVLPSISFLFKTLSRSVSIKYDNTKDIL